jgi:hypothetical protein
MMISSLKPLMLLSLFMQQCRFELYFGYCLSIISTNLDVTPLGLKFLSQDT